jgi:phosphatidylglycerophosphate synthase
MRWMKDSALLRIAAAVHHCGLTPNALTAVGLCFGVMSGVLFSQRVVLLAFVSGFVSVFFDLLDGTVARGFHLETMFGLIFDSVADRVSEIAVVLGALFSGIIQPLGVIAIVGSVLLLLLRALSYSRGARTDYVIFGRFERLLLIMFGLISPTSAVSTFCFVVAGTFGLASSLQIAIALLHKPARGRISWT